MTLTQSDSQPGAGRANLGNPRKPRERSRCPRCSRELTPSVLCNVYVSSDDEPSLQAPAPLTRSASRGAARGPLALASVLELRLPGEAFARARRLSDAQGRRPEFVGCSVTSSRRAWIFMSSKTARNEPAEAQVTEIPTPSPVNPCRVGYFGVPPSTRGTKGGMLRRDTLIRASRFYG